MKKKIVVVPASRWQLSLINFLKRKKFYVYSLDDDDNAMGHKYSDKRLNIKTNEIKKIIKFTKKHNLKIISCCSDFGERICYSLKNKSIRMFNKYYQRKIQKKNGIETPFFQKDILTYSNQKKFKEFIVKPVIGSGSRDVSKINKTFKTIYKKGYLFEQFIEGKEYNVDGFFYNKKLYVYGVMEKKKVKNSFTVSYLLNYSRLTLNQTKKIRELLLFFFNKMKYPNGPVHAEIIINDKKKPIIVESHPREVGFDVYYQLLRNITGLNLHQNTLNARLNLKIKENSLISKNKFKYFCTRMIPINKNGIIDYIKFKKIKKNKNIVIFKKLFVKSGDKINKIDNDSSRLGYILCMSNKVKNLTFFSKKILDKKFILKYK